MSRNPLAARVVSIHDKKNAPSVHHIFGHQAHMDLQTQNYLGSTETDMRHNYDIDMENDTNGGHKR